MGSAPNHKKSSVRKPEWVTLQDNFQKMNKKCQKVYPECPKEEGKYCSNCPFK